MAPEKECMLVTQNVDNLHESLAQNSAVLHSPLFKDIHFSKNLPKGSEAPIAFTPHVYAIHGNCHYMRKSNDSTV